jgi:hypothetical protein
MPSEPRDEYVLTLVDALGDDRALVEVRLRRALKSLLRAWGLRCTRAVRAGGAEAEAEAPTGGRSDGG